MKIKPSPIVAVPNVPVTRVSLRAREPEMGGPIVIVRRGKGNATRVKIHRGDWT